MDGFSRRQTDNIFLFFPKQIGSDTSCKLSPIWMKCQWSSLSCPLTPLYLVPGDKISRGPWVILSWGQDTIVAVSCPLLLFRPFCLYTPIFLICYKCFILLSFQQARKSLFLYCSMEDNNFSLCEVKYTYLTQVHIEILLIGQV